MTSDLLKSLWLQRLPSNVQAILAISAESLDNLANMADKICEVPSSSEVNLIQSSVPSSISNTTIEFQIAELSKQVAMLNAKMNHQNRPGSRTSRQRSRSRTPAHGFRGSSQSEAICWYHKRFKAQASKCIKPCTFKTKFPENK